MSTIKDMKPEIVQQWVTDLRSGEFTQTAGVLVDPALGDKCRCALGVLLYRAEEQGVVVRQGGTFVSTDGNPAEIYHDSDTSLPLGAQEWAGIPGINSPDVRSAYGYDYDVITLNDDLGMSFEEIADLIEDNLAA